jgi:hypothetical protein
LFETYFLAVKHFLSKFGKKIDALYQKIKLILTLFKHFNIRFYLATRLKMRPFTLKY